MQQDSKHTIQYKLLLDDPVAKDAFSSTGELGPHERTAKTIAEMISEDAFQGKMIALEGGWGSGKSSVVKMIESVLRAENGGYEKTDHRCIIFDAWAHQGDPLRRGFIESITQELRRDDITWLVDEADSQANLDVCEEIDKLAKRITNTSDETTRIPTGLALWFALSVLCIPIGGSLFTATYSELGPTTWSAPPHWLFLSSALLSAAPLIVAVVNAINIFRRASKNSFSWKQRLKELASPANWPLLNDTSTVKSQSTTITTADPTSIEFEKAFVKIMDWVLGDHAERRLVIVVDNLDRLEPERALEMWGTLQTFFECRNCRSDSAWWKQLCFIAPFDSEAIQRLWSSRQGVDEGIHQAEPYSPGHEIENSFIDKSFVTRFRVPPIVLTEWQGYLAEQLKEACAGIDDEEVDRVIRVCDLMQANDAAFRPTPRNIKKVVNQVVNHLRQWSGAEVIFEPAVVTCFVLLDRIHSENDLYKSLVTGSKPDEAIRRILGEEGMMQLAGLYYNTTPQKGEQILLDQPISDALRSGKAEEMRALTERQEGRFWSVFHRWLDKDIQDYNWDFFAGAIRVVSGMGWTRSTDPAAKRVVEAIGEKVKQEEEKKVPNQNLAELLLMLKDIGLDNPRKIAFDFWSRTTNREKGNVPPPTLEALKTIVDGFSDQEPTSHKNKLVIHVNGTEWVDLLSEIGAGDDWKGTKYLIPGPGVSPTAIESELQTQVSGKLYEERDRLAVRALSRSHKPKWGQLAPAIAEALKSANATSPNDQWLLSTLLDMHSIGLAEGEKQLKSLAEPAHLLDLLYRYHSEGNEAMVLLITFAFLSANPEAKPKTQKGNSAHGQNQLDAILADANKAEGFVELLIDHDDFDIVLETLIQRKSIDPLIKESLLVARKQGLDDSVITTDALWRAWGKMNSVFTQDVIEERLPKHAADLVGHIADDENLYSTDLDMYKALLKDPEADWFNSLQCALDKHLNKWSKENWSKEFLESGTYADFILWLFETSAAPSLGNDYMEGLKQVALALIKGGNLKDTVNPQGAWLDHFESSDASERLSEFVVKEVAEAQACPTDHFFLMFGHLLRNAIISGQQRDKVAAMLYQILTNHTEVNVAWILDLCQHPDTPDLRQLAEKTETLHHAITDLLDNEKISDEVRKNVQSISEAILPLEHFN